MRRGNIEATSQSIGEKIMHPIKAIIFSEKQYKKEEIKFPRKSRGNEK